jgi:hypothetical protein
MPQLPRWARQLGMSEEQYEGLIDFIHEETEQHYARIEESNTVPIRVVEVPAYDDGVSYEEEYDPVDDNYADLTAHEWTEYWNPYLGEPFEAQAAPTMRFASAGYNKPKVFIDCMNRVRVCPNGGCCGYICNGIKDGQCTELESFTQELAFIVERAQSTIDAPLPGRDIKPPVGRKIIRKKED